MNDLKAAPLPVLLDALERRRQLVARDRQFSSEHLAAHELEVCQLELEIQKRELHRAQHALESSHARYLSQYDFAPIALLTLDPSGVVMECNLTAAAVLAGERPLVIGMPLVHFITPHHWRAFLNHLFVCKREGHCITEISIGQKGSETPISVLLYSVLVEHHGLGLSLRSALTDISERKRTELALMQAHTELEARVSERTAQLEAVNRQLREKVAECELLESQLMERMRQLGIADRSKDQFLAMLAHELRNPLSPLQNAMYLIRTENPEQSACDQLHKMMQRQLDQLVRIVDDLLEVTRFTQGKIQVRMDVIELGKVLRAAAESSSHFIGQRHHQFEIQMPDEPVQVSGDEVRLVQALVNLLNNASKYTDEGGRISLAARCEGEEVVIRVRDSGVGIAPDMLDRIFELFTQAPHTLERAQGGLGVGLTLARSIIEMHQGKIVAHSNGVGTGSEFEIRLPVAHDQIPAPEAKEQSHRNCKRVLVVDDNRDAGESLMALVEHWGHEARLALEGRGAIALAADFHPQVVLLDIGLPGLDGYGVVRELRSHAGMEDAVIVAVTGYGQKDDRRRAQLAGFNHHLVKPVNPEALERLLSQ